MSTIGTGVPGAPRDAATPDAGAKQATPAAAAQTATTPYWLLWSTGIVAVMLGMAAFVLWGISGASTLFDMIVALCT